MDNEDDSTNRIYVNRGKGKDTVLSGRNVQNCQRATIKWVNELLTDCSGFGDIDPDEVSYGPGVVRGWDQLKVPSTSKLNTLSKKTLLEFTKKACSIMIEQSYTVACSGITVMELQ